MLGEFSGHEIILVFIFWKNQGHHIFISRFTDLQKCGFDNLFISLCNVQTLFLLPSFSKQHTVRKTRSKGVQKLFNVSSQNFKLMFIRGQRNWKDQQLFLSTILSFLYIAMTKRIIIAKECLFLENSLTTLFQSNFFHKTKIFLRLSISIFFKRNSEFYFFEQNWTKNTVVGLQ